ncbi:hypothetical protein QQF64_005077 [Cirrhinus molitorella]|uniref:Uncharacterized protein n=1 Tax=Cirrhinus molitorella TaxID=172907 RepID=A0ABR3MI37_9TELE
MEGRLHLSNLADEDPSLRRPDRGRTLSNHARHGPQSREPASQSAKRSLIPLGLFLSDQLTHCHSVSHTHSCARALLFILNRRDLHFSTLFPVRVLSRALSRSSLAARASVSASVLYRMNKNGRLLRESR